MNIKDLEAFQKRSEELSDKAMVFREKFPDLPPPPTHEFHQFREAIENERTRLCRKGERIPEYGIPLLCLTSHQHATLVFQAILSKILFGPVPLTAMAIEIGIKCGEERKRDMCAGVAENVEALITPKYSRPKPAIETHRSNFDPENWREEYVDVRLGAYLLYLFLKHTKLIGCNFEKPVGEKIRLACFLHDNGLRKHFLGNRKNKLLAQPRLPMVIKPKSWGTQSAGGYLSTPNLPLFEKKFAKKNFLPKKSWEKRS